jgi:hypothetical protein
MIPRDITEAFGSSEMGARLCGPFPIGTLHRGNLDRLLSWQERYHPTVKHRTPKKRRRRGR